MNLLSIGKLLSKKQSRFQEYYLLTLNSLRIYFLIYKKLPILIIIVEYITTFCLSYLFPYSSILYSLFVSSSLIKLIFRFNKLYLKIYFERINEMFKFKQKKMIFKRYFSFFFIEVWLLFFVIRIEEGVTPIYFSYHKKGKIFRGCILDN